MDARHKHFEANAEEMTEFFPQRNYSNETVISEHRWSTLFRCFFDPHVAVHEYTTYIYTKKKA